jgi:Mn2+/Fe2+ NRAMP family transporter
MFRAMKPPAAQTEDDAVVITHEDVDRAHDRSRVSAARAQPGFSSRARLLWLLLGPGVLVMLGENDGPSMLSYAATGAKFGIGFFIPFVALTFCMAIVVQEMTVRLGAATHRGHAELIFDRFGPFWGWFSMIDLGLGNFLTLITEFIAIRAGLGFFGVRPWIAILIALVILYGALMSHRYWTWERITLAAAAFNLVFVPVALMTHPSWPAVGHAFITWQPLPGFSKDTLLIVLADIGATVTPWMLFFQQSATVDKGMTTKDIGFGFTDTVIGAALATAAAIVLIPGLPLVYVVLVVNVVAVLAMPPALVFLFMLVNDQEIMGDLVSPLWANILSGGVVFLLTAAGILFGISIIAPNLFAALGGK